MPRVACGDCGKMTQTELPRLRSGSGFTTVMEAFVNALCQGLPLAQVAKLVGVSFKSPMCAPVATEPTVD